MSFPFKIPERYRSQNTRFDGGQAFVYICHDDYLDRPVAIKVMRNISDTEVLRKEFASLRDVRSANIAEIYDLVIAKRSGMVGLVQEFVPGPTLSERIHTGIPNDSKVLVLYQLANAISDVHACQKIHRDVKPDNIKFDAEGVLKLLDFGLVRDRRIETQTMNTRGTLYFLAPELYGDPPFKLSPAIDVYAFGVTAWLVINDGQLCQELSEIPPFQTGSAPSFQSVAPELSSSVCGVLDACVAQRSADRPEMRIVSDVLKRNVLYGRHRATLLHRSKTYVLSEPGDVFVINDPGINFKVQYDGLSFVILDCQGEVFINNVPAQSGKALPSSCVITVGAWGGYGGRSFIPFDVSHPEVVL